ncbi:hypothetical protein BGX33_008534 [Mortierella sp. NVP41]|nr:hypothetical protein BGX33_008534 [Mortierella sp. NVP41]
MTAFVIKIASALAVFACAVQAVPLATRCSGASCYQAASSGSVQVGSVTNIVPETNITPITRYQPIVKAYAPIVDSQCAPGLLGYGVDCPLAVDRPYLGIGRDPAMLDRGAMLPMEEGPAFDMLSRDRLGFMSRVSRMGIIRPRIGLGNPMMKRDKVKTETMMRPGCVPSATDSCVVNVPASTTDMGSTTTAIPKNVVQPSTVYQGKVQAETAEVEAADATHQTLASQRVNLASDTKIQPITKVFPETTYQPSVDQKATVVQAAPAVDQSLDRSSVSMGSSVYIRPTVTVEPLTIFRPKIQSLPFIIHSETACDQIGQTQTYGQAQAQPPKIKKMEEEAEC